MLAALPLNVQGNPVLMERVRAIPGIEIAPAKPAKEVPFRILQNNNDVAQNFPEEDFLKALSAEAPAAPPADPAAAGRMGS